MRADGHPTSKLLTEMWSNPNHGSGQSEQEPSNARAGSKTTGLSEVPVGRAVCTFCYRTRELTKLTSVHVIQSVKPLCCGRDDEKPNLNRPFMASKSSFSRKKEKEIHF